MGLLVSYRSYQLLLARQSEKAKKPPKNGELRDGLP